MTLAGGPFSLTRPFSMTMTRSKRRNRSASGCMTMMRVRSRNIGPSTSSSRRNLAVGASTAPKGSSSNVTEAVLRYAARAMATRAFCPPDKATPRAPINAESPPSMTLRSDSKEAQYSA
mmetsp:Transcript_39400/g.113253  ORF Transcript_39400/g.113253 Transcript_39400/m.113253 type:complete len:119 (-) Transcript_39400:1999-2355(-)